MRVILRPTVAADLPAVIAEALPVRIRAITAVLHYDRPSIAADEGEAEPRPIPAFLPAPLPDPLPDPLPAPLPAPLPDPPAPKVIGVGGIAWLPDGRGGNRVVAFVQALPQARRFPVAFHRAGLLAMAMIRDSGVAQVLATVDTDSAVNRRWIERLGFHGSDLDEAEPGKVIYIWTPDAQPAADI